MIISDINPLSRQKKACLRSACFPNGASRRETLELFSQLLEFWTVYLWRERFSVFEVVALVCPSRSSLHHLCRWRQTQLTSRLFNPKVDVRHFPGLLPQRIFRGIRLSAALFSKWPSKSDCKWVLRSFFGALPQTRLGWCLTRAQRWSCGREEPPRGWRRRWDGWRGEPRLQFNVKLQTTNAVQYQGVSNPAVKYFMSVLMDLQLSPDIQLHFPS